jgi:hypothetical protein
MNFLMEYANNLADGLYPFIIGLTLVGVMVGLISWLQRDFKDSDPYLYGSDRYVNATWRMMASAQGVVLMWLVWSVVNAVPEPNYIYQERVKTVVKEVNTATNYFEVYDECIERRRKLDTSREDDAKFCDNRAILATKPNAILRITVPKTVVKTVTVPSSYSKLYEDCMKPFSARNNQTPDIEMRQAMDQCDSQARNNSQ